MLIGEIVRVALQSIRANLFRATLTMLGIIIGVGAVIAMLAAGAGAQQRIDEQIASLGANVLQVNASRFFARGIARNQLTLNVEDVWALRDDGRYFEYVVPQLEDRGQIQYANRNSNARIIGTTTEYVAIFNYQLAHGRFFTEAEDEARQRIAVLGADVPGDLEANAASMVGQSISLNGRPFRIIGILEGVGGGGGFGSRGPDSSVIIPLQTADHRMFGREELEDISVAVMDGVPLERAMVEIERVLRREHRIMPGEPNDFAIVDQREFLDTQQQAQQTFTVLLASIAGVSLLVGGIGIMNIMLVSVTERTREIGIRMALGATRMTILMQFLVESIALCLLGGLLGVAFGAGAAHLMSRLAGWATYVSPESVFMATGFSVGVGLFFGIWPARRAARLDPIEALRYE